MKFGLLCFAAMLAVGAVQATKPSIDRSIVAMQMPGLDGTLKTFCSGVVAQTVPVPYVITEAHCVDEELPKVRINGLEVAVVASAHDLALLRISGWLADAVPVRVAAQSPQVGTAVRARGWGFGKGLLQTHGHYSGELADESFFDMQVVKGMSGGPVFDEHDEVVSLVRAFQTDGSLVDDVPSPNGFLVGAPVRHLLDVLVLMRALDVGR